jgi:hypothetical protein
MSADQSLSPAVIVGIAIGVPSLVVATTSLGIAYFNSIRSRKSRRQEDLERSPVGNFGSGSECLPLNRRIIHSTNRTSHMRLEIETSSYLATTDEALPLTMHAGALPRGSSQPQRAHQLTQDSYLSQTIPSLREICERSERRMYSHLQ